MLKYALAAVGWMLSLSGCTTMGIDSGQALRDEFEAPVSYQKVYLRARHQAELCLRGESRHQVEGVVDELGRNAQVYVRAPFTESRLVSVNIRPLDESRSQVSVVMWGVKVWDQHAVLAMRDAILVGVPTCRSYMPIGKGDNPRKR